MEPVPDPACEGARDLTALHARQSALLIAGLDPSSELARTVRARHVRDLKAHESHCLRCWTYARSCRACGADLTQRGHRWLCRHQAHRWRFLLGGWREPLVREAPPGSPAPAQAPTPPPARGVTTASAKPRGAAASPTPPPGAPPSPPPPRALPDPHRVLGVRRGASAQELRRAYRALALQWHPDRVAPHAPELRAAAQRRMGEINAAYEALRR